MITILVITALLGSAVISRIESCNIGGFQYIPPPCEPCQPDSSGKLARIFFNNRCCELTTTITKGLLITGGYSYTSAHQSVEVYVPSTGQQCQLPDLPDRRVQHTLENRILCGSGVTSPSCLTLTDDGTWEKTTTTLLEQRYGHSSWDSPSGLILLGGYYSPKTTEKILQDGGSSYSFDLEHSTRDACAINLGSSVLITGGEFTLTRVTEYTEDGWVRDLPDLLQGRWRHGCSSYDNNDGTQTMLVTGGWTGSPNFDTLSSTELLVGTADDWVPAGELPSPRYGLRGANIDNRVLMTGGWEGRPSFSTLDEILEFEPLTGQWRLVDRMIQDRSAHAVSTITFDSGLCD